MKTYILNVAANEISSGSDDKFKFEIQFLSGGRGAAITFVVHGFSKSFILFFFNSCGRATRPGLSQAALPNDRFELFWNDKIEMQKPSISTGQRTHPNDDNSDTCVCAVWSMDTDRFHCHAGEIRCWTRSQSRITNFMLHDILIALQQVYVQIILHLLNACAAPSLYFGHSYKASPLGSDGKSM